METIVGAVNRICSKKHCVLLPQNVKVACCYFALYGKTPILP